MQWNPAQLLSLFLRASLPFSQPNVLLPLQPPFTWRTSGHCLGTFIAVNLALTVPILNVVSHANHPVCLLSVSLLGLKEVTLGYSATLAAVQKPIPILGHQSKSKWQYDWRPLSQFALALSPFAYPRPYLHCLDIYSLCRRRASCL
jgi:hypothetical protein